MPGCVSVCVYLSICACMYVYNHGVSVCVCLCIYVCICVGTHGMCMHVSVMSVVCAVCEYACLCACVYLCMHMCLCMFAHVWFVSMRRKIETGLHTASEEKATQYGTMEGSAGWVKP